MQASLTPAFLQIYSGCDDPVCWTCSILSPLSIMGTVSRHRHALLKRRRSLRRYWVYLSDFVSVIALPCNEEYQSLQASNRCRQRVFSLLAHAQLMLVNTRWGSLFFYPKMNEALAMLERCKFSHEPSSLTGSERI
jgi:hypothetical protein